MSRRAAGLAPSQRLTAGGQFRRVLGAGVRLDGRLFKLVAAENGRGYDRLGIAASRQVGGAVRRNRAKRVLREAFRRHRRDDGPGHDLVLLAKREIVEATQADVDREYHERLLRLQRRSARPRRPPAPRGD